MTPTTLIIQSYKTNNVSPWISSCMESVQRWADVKGYSYLFVDDAFFDYAPGWIHDLPNSFYPVTDIARLYLLKDKLQHYNCVVWVDADVIVFDTDIFCIPTNIDCGFAGELLIDTQIETGIRQIYYSLNNSVMFFNKNSPMLDAYIDRAELELRTKEIHRTIIGPSLLRMMNDEYPIPVLSSVGLFPMKVMINRSVYDDYISAWSYPLGAANMCGFQTSSPNDRDRAGISMEDIDQAITYACNYLFSTGNNQCVQ